MKEEEWNDIVATNLGSVFRLSKGVLTGLKRRIERNNEIAMLSIEDAESLQQALQACSTAYSRAFCRACRKGLGHFRQDKQEQRMTEQTLAQEIALVTGASRGIGRAIASELARRGATVVGTATSEAGAQGITQQLAESGKVRGIVLNVADAQSIEAALKDIEAHEGAPTVLVNNAGITRDNLLLRMKEEEWNDIVATNLGSVFRLSKGVVRGMMKARRGRIISIASVVGVMGNAGQTNYAAAKAGIIGFSKSLAREVGSRGLTVNVVAPGFIATDMTAKLPAEQQAALTAQIALGRLGAVEDIAAAVAFLASPQAGYITGETLHVNGGMYMV
jgi:3-oxoacyl-[acyl-carrier protein] reductase